MDEEIRQVEIKDLNKTQLIWLAVLLSFIVSIATGIVTVTLMQQAPTGVTQTINRVVQQTIEKVVPDYTPGTTQTVIIKEDDLVADAVNTVRANTAILLMDKDTALPINEAYALSNTVFLVGDATIDPLKTYTLQIGSQAVAVKSISISPLGFALLSAPGAAAIKSLRPIPFAKESNIKAGQTAVIVSRKTVAKGILQSVQKGEAVGDVSWNRVFIDPEPLSNSIGSLVVNLDGAIIGLVAAKADAGTAIVSESAIAEFMAKSPVAVVPSSN